jgi:hypothetical protein
MTRKTKAVLQQENEELLARIEALSLRIGYAERANERVVAERPKPSGTAAPDIGPSPSPSFEHSLFGRLVGILPNLWTLIPWVVVIAGGIYWYRSQSTTIIDPPAPPDVVTIEKAVGDYFPTQRAEFAKTFADAAAKVRAKEITTDEQLDALINPQLKAARDLAGKPFDVSFDMGLPRNDDGTFTGKEDDAAKFLELISRSW